MEPRCLEDPVLTEDDLGKALREGSMTVDQVMAAVAGETDEQVFVYPPVNPTEGSETWEEVEEMGAASTLFADLRKAGATDEQMDQVGADIARLRAAGHTLDKVFEWPVDGEATTDVPVDETGDNPV